MLGKYKDQRSCLECTNKSHLFQHLSNPELEMIDNSKAVVNFNKGETIRKQGAVLTHVVSLNKGLAKVYLEGPSNKNIIMAIIKPPTFIGGPGMFIDHKHHFTVTSITDTCVCFIDRDIFKKLLHQNIAFSDAYLKHLSNVTLSAYNRLINFTQKQMAGRLADSLIYLSEEIFNERKFELILSNSELAELSGMSKDNVGRTLRRFKLDGMIKNRGHTIEILDFEALQQTSQTG